MGKHAPRRTHKGLDPERMHPSAQSLGIKLLKHASDFRCTRAIAREKFIRGFGVGDIEPTPSRHQELAAHRGLCLIDLHRHALSDQRFRSH